MRAVRREVRDTISRAVSTSPDENDYKSKRPPLRRAEVVAFAVVALLVIAVMAVLYVARAFSCPPSPRW